MLPYRSASWEKVLEQFELLLALTDLSGLIGSSTDAQSLLNLKSATLVFMVKDLFPEGRVPLQLPVIDTAKRIWLGPRLSGSICQNGSRRTISGSTLIRFDFDVQFCLEKLAPQQ
jgi:hypothetical protein